jgi:hypothetical protein
MSPADQSAVASYVEAALVRHGATRNGLLFTAMNAWAPQDVVERLLELPEGYYRNLDEVLAKIA